MIGRLDVGVEPSQSDSMPVTCRLLHEFFVSAARRWPNRVAVDLPPGRGRPDRTLTTYAQLDRQSNAIAELLRARIAGECAVGILLPRDSADLYAAQLAVLKAGAAHVCVESSFPDERVRDILQDVEAAAVLTDGPGLERAKRVGLDLALVFDVSCISSLVRSAPSGWPDYCADAQWAHGRESRLSDLHLGNDRPPEGRDDRAPERGQSRGRQPGGLPTRAR